MSREKQGRAHVVNYSTRKQEAGKQSAFSQVLSLYKFLRPGSKSPALLLRNFTLIHVFIVGLIIIQDYVTRYVNYLHYATP